jgi:predicted nucleic acid-binding protein
LILLDTSVWVDQLRHGDPAVASLLECSRVLAHPRVISAITLGHLQHRALVLALLNDLPPAQIAGDDELVTFIDHRALSGERIGYVDAHRLASVIVTTGARLWTRDERLARVATRLGVAHP